MSAHSEVLCNCHEIYVACVGLFFSTGLVRTQERYGINGKLCKTWPGLWNSGSTNTGTIRTPLKQRKSFLRLAHKWHLCRWVSSFHNVSIHVLPRAIVLDRRIIKNDSFILHRDEIQGAHSKHKFQPTQLYSSEVSFFCLTNIYILKFRDIQACV